MEFRPLGNGQFMGINHDAVKLNQTLRLIRDLITQAEACNFTDRHGHALEMNAAYKALKDSVSE